MSELETLSAEEQAYFSSRGETLEAEKPTPEEPKVEDVSQDDTTAEVDDDLPEEVETEEVTTEETGEAEAEKQNKQVPLRALTKTREELKAEKARAAAIEAEAKVLRERWDQMLAAQQKPQEEAKPESEVDPAKDPLAAVNAIWEERKQEKLTKAEQEKQAEEQRKQQEVWTQTLNVARGQFQEAATADEAFEPTYNAVRQSLFTEYKEVYGLDDQQALAEVDQFEANQIAYAVQRGVNVADQLRAIARVRGVKPPQPEKKPEPDTEAIDRLEKGVSGSTSLSAASGGRSTTQTAESIANMSAADFEKWLSKNGSGGFRKLAGG